MHDCNPLPLAAKWPKFNDMPGTSSEKSKPIERVRQKLRSIRLDRTISQKDGSRFRLSPAYSLHHPDMRSPSKEESDILWSTPSSTLAFVQEVIVDSISLEANPQDGFLGCQAGRRWFQLMLNLDTVLLVRMDNSRTAEV
jgi:hypothetical protein